MTVRNVQSAMKNFSYDLLLSTLLPNIQLCLGMELKHQGNNETREFDGLMVVIVVLLLPLIALVHGTVYCSQVYYPTSSYSWDGARTPRR